MSWLTVVILAGIILAFGTAVTTLATGTPSQFPGFREPGSYPLALAITVLTVAYFGLGYQYFQLRFAKRGGMYFTLFIFIAWILPIVAGSIQSMSSWGPTGRDAGAPIFAVSPGAGIGMVAAIGDENLATSIQAAAITPALLFTFVFNYLIIGARRRVMKRVFAATAKKDEDGVSLELAEPVVEGV